VPEVKSETFPDHPFGLADSFGLAANPFGLSLSKPSPRNN